VSKEKSTKRILFPNPISKKTQTLIVEKALIQNADEYPVSIITFYEDVPLTIYIDKNFAVRGVEKAIYIEQKSAKAKIESPNSDESSIIEEYSKAKNEIASDTTKLYQMLVLGLSKAGKTSFINSLSKHKLFNKKIKPTLGTHIVKSVIDNLNFQIFDVGGQVKLRHTWYTACKNPEAVIYIFDLSSSEDEIKESRMEFDRMLENIFNEDDKREIPLLILGNKSDLFTKDNVSPKSLMQAVISVFEPNRLKKPYQVGLISALNNEGIDFNFQWIIKEKISALTKLAF
jgi:ADP-ribosylation factor-like protein 5B